VGRIIIEGLSMAFGEANKTVQALGEITLTIESGEFTSVVGPSGAGKTTFLRILSGVLSPTAGRVTCGDDTGRGRAMVFQEDRLLPWRTVLDNVAYGLEVRGIDKEERRRQARRYVELVGLSGFGKRYPQELSGGMRQRANLARALAIEPDILLMDEPFASVDHQTREIMQYELLTIWERTHQTVLFVTHQIDEAVYLSDRLIVFSGRPGRVKADLPVEMPRPRDLAVKRSPQFVEYVDRVWALLESDLRKVPVPASAAVEGG
jgi:NitT/TauT family transport system ATP-binding protein